jgi:hypothetical protein
MSATRTKKPTVGDTLQRLLGLVDHVVGAAPGDSAEDLAEAEALSKETRCGVCHRKGLRFQAFHRPGRRVTVSLTVCPFCRAVAPY